MPGVLLAHQSAGEQREPGLHEEHEVSGDQRPGEVGADPDVADVIGQLDGQRLFRRLGLELVEVFLLLGVVRRARVGRLRNHERIARRVGGCGLVSGGRARGIGRRSIVRETWGQETAQHHSGKKEYRTAQKQRPSRPTARAGRGGSRSSVFHLFLLIMLAPLAQRKFRFCFCRKMGHDSFSGMN